MRLIDADIVTQSIENLMANGATVEQALDAQPTAYGVDKVVGKLEREIEIKVTQYPLHGRYIKKSRAIQIVKEGGVNEQ